MGLYDILFSTLKGLDLTVLYDFSVPLPPTGLNEELEAMAGHNMLEVLSFEVQVDGDETVDSIGSILQKAEEALLKPGWSVLRRVSFIVSIAYCLASKEENIKLSDALQSLPDKYLSRLPKLESLTFNFSVYVVNGID